MLTPTQAAPSNNGSQVTVSGAASAGTVAQAAQQALAAYVAGGPPATVTVNGVQVPAAIALSAPQSYANGQQGSGMTPSPVNSAPASIAASNPAIAQSEAAMVASEQGTPVTIGGITYANAAIAAQYGK